MLSIYRLYSPHCKHHQCACAQEFQDIRARKYCFVDVLRYELGHSGRTKASISMNVPMHVRTHAAVDGRHT